MNIKHLIISVTLVAASAFALGAMAGDTDRFTALDTDGDGAISAEEASAHPMLQEGWEKADINQDGKLERAEFSAFEETAVPMTK